MRAAQSRLAVLAAAQKLGERPFQAVDRGAAVRSRGATQEDNAEGRGQQGFELADMRLEGARYTLDC